jgi:hypothetical protein
MIDSLNESVFKDRPIEDDALASLLGISTLGPERAAHLICKLIEKGDEIRSPSDFLRHHARKAGLAPSGDDAPRATTNRPDRQYWRCAGQDSCGKLNPYSTWRCRCCGKSFGM